MDPPIYLSHLDLKSRFVNYVHKILNNYVGVKKNNKFILCRADNNLLLTFVQKKNIGHLMEGNCI